MAYPPISTSGPCECCAPTPALSSWESQTWVNYLGPFLCGQIDYEGSDPDTFYRNESASGGFNVKTYLSSCDEENLVDEEDVTWGGSCVSDSGGACDAFGQDPPGLTRNGDPVGCGAPSVLSGNEIYGTVTTAATTYDIAGSGECVTGIGTGGGFAIAVTGSGSASLSSPDSEAEAIDRDNPGGDYSSWADAGTSSVYAEYIPPTSGARSFTYYKAKFRATVSGLSTGQTVDVAVDVFRDSVLFATLTGSVTEDGSGSGTWEDEVPIARGSSTWVDPTTFVITP